MRRKIYATSEFKNKEFMDYGINDGEGYIRTYDEYVKEFNEDKDLQEDFSSVDDYISSMIENGDVKVFSDVSDEEYDHYN